MKQLYVCEAGGLYKNANLSLKLCEPQRLTVNLHLVGLVEFESILRCLQRHTKSFGNLLV